MKLYAFLTVRVAGTSPRAFHRCGPAPAAQGYSAGIVRTGVGEIISITPASAAPEDTVACEAEVDCGGR
jgi:hypothetical protein